MSVSDPLIKDIKGYTLKLFSESRTHNRITDSNESLLGFCKVLEEIFRKGLIQCQNSFYRNKKIALDTWMFSVASERSSYVYKNCVEEVQSFKGVNTSLGRFRLLVRHCLMKKCLHLPLELLNTSNKARMFYGKNSILGDEILSAILLSVLLQCSKINFQLQLDNCSFLDYTWRLPEMVKLEMVPCKSLGISISFSDNKAVIVHIKSNSVASEFAEISVGDILTKLNNVEINSSCKGRLHTILNMKNGQPNNLEIAKAFCKKSNDIFPPIKIILRNLQVDFDKVMNSRQIDDKTETAISRNTKAGYKATYLGFVDVGNNGSVKQIEEAVKRRLNMPKGGVREEIIFEIGEMAVKIFNVNTNDIILKHSYMQISSCGSVHSLPNHVAYIAGNENCDTASKFFCYIFYTENTEDACTILQSIGQGFYRTHFAV